MIDADESARDGGKFNCGLIENGENVVVAERGRSRNYPPAARSCANDVATSHRSRHASSRWSSTPLVVVSG